MRFGLLLGVLAGCGATEAAPDQATPDKPVTLGSSAKLDKAIATYYGTTNISRSYIQTDKPLYQPGETIWMRADVRANKTMTGGTPIGATLQLISPRGAIAASKRVLVQQGIARGDFALPAEIEGGEYTMKLVTDAGTTDEKKVIINTYEAPRLMKTLELLRKAYGPNDQVTAAVEVKRTTGEPFADKTLTAVVTLDDAEISRTQIKTDAEGKTIAKFQLPATIARGDGLLTIMADDGGVTESIQKRVPIVMSTISLSALPEGGDLVEGVPGRVYFMAKTLIGKPADIEGKLVDDKGATVAEFASTHDGMGRVELTPQAGRRYHLEVTKPSNITTKADVPIARADGCVLRSVDQKAPDRLRIGAICKTKQKLEIEATLRENRLAGGSFEVAANQMALVELPIAQSSQGAVRVTLFSTEQEPLAERLVYHGRGGAIKVEITADKPGYAPRDKVKLHVKTTDVNGKPVAANVGLAVVDDTVLSYADDKSARILAHTYLEPELGATAQDPIEEPNYYFSDKPDAVAAMDALLATRGYRRFEWRNVLPRGAK